MADPSRSGSVRHERTRSAAQARPRSATKGPLDADEMPPLTSPSLNRPLSPRVQQQQRFIQPGRGSPSPGSPLLRSSLSPRRPNAPKDFSYLLRPEIYHPLTAPNIPAPFLTSKKQPPADTPLPELLARGQYRAAAIAATNLLTGAGPDPAPSPTEHARIFDLLYTRLACLTLVDGGTAVAAQEVKALEDLTNSAFYVDASTRLHLVPWALRVLSVRLQAIVGFGDPRRAIISYYELAKEARAQLAGAGARHDHSASELWKARLADLGLQVAGVLVEMDDLAGAAAHLRGMRDRGDGRMTVARALLWLHMGDVDAARECVVPGAVGEKMVAALCDMADGEYGSALEKWRKLREEEEGGVDDEMIGVNMAVCMLYVGSMPEGKAILEDLVDKSRASHSLLFNLTTMYELCTERSRELKMALAEKVAGMEEGPNGWEKSNADFKL